MVEIVAPEQCPCCGHMPAFVTRTCKQCGREFRASRNQVLVGKALVCGRHCAQASKRKPHMPLVERFMSKVEITDTCWLWKAGHFPNGYGFIRMRGQPGGSSKMAHRVSYEMHNGPIPQGMVIMHTCDNPPCVRPDHLILGTLKDNAADMMSKGRGKPWGRPPKARSSAT